MTFFPAKKFNDAGAYANAYFDLFVTAAATVDRSAIDAAATLLTVAVKRGAIVFSCGNGGSAAIANHLVCDHLKGIRTDTGLRPKVHSFSATVELITAIANDIGTEEIFSFQLSSMGSPGDVLIAISSSGSSLNIVAALREAKHKGLTTIAMTGFGGGEARKLADVSLHVDMDNYGIVEDVHQSLMHILAQYVRHADLDDPSALGSLKF